MTDDVNARLAAASPVELLQRDDLVRECRDLRARIAALEALPDRLRQEYPMNKHAVEWAGWFEKAGRESQ